MQFVKLNCFRFGGDPAPNSIHEGSAASENLSLIERIKLGISDTAKSFVIDMWLARHTPEKVLPRLVSVLDAAKEEFADAVANGGGVYGVGYCFGAKYILILAGEHPDSVLHGQEKAGQSETGQSMKGSSLKAGAIAHGTQITPDEMAAVRAPTLLICVENDPLFPEEIRKIGVERLEKAGTKHEVHVYPEVPHGEYRPHQLRSRANTIAGFAVLGDYPNPKIKEAQQAAFGQMLGWLKEH